MCEIKELSKEKMIELLNNQLFKWIFFNLLQKHLIYNSIFDIDLYNQNDFIEDLEKECKKVGLI